MWMVEFNSRLVSCNKVLFEIISLLKDCKMTARNVWTLTFIFFEKITISVIRNVLQFPKIVV